MITAATGTKSAEKPSSTGVALSSWFWPVAAIVLLSLAVRLYHLGEKGLFIDEIYSVLVAGGNADPLLLQFDSVRPLYFVLLKAWMAAGQSEYWLRMFSVIFGVLNVFLVYRLGSVAASRSAGLAAALLLALSPLAVDSSQLVRMYTLGTFLGLTGCLFLMAASNSDSRRPILLWALFRFLSVLTLPLTVLMLIADSLVVWKYRAEFRFPKTMIAGMAVILIFWCPFAVRLFELRTSLYDLWRADLHTPGLSELLKQVINFTCVASPVAVGPPVSGWLSYAYILLVTGLLAGGLTLSRQSRNIQWCAVWACVPLVLMFIWSQFAPSLYVSRYLMFTAPFFFILIGAGWAELLRIPPVCLTVSLAVLTVVSVSLFHHFEHPVHEDWRLLSEHVMNEEKTGDRIAIWGVHSQFPMRYYYRGQCSVHDMGLAGRAGAYSPDDFWLQFQGLKRKEISRLWVIIKAVPWPGRSRNSQIRMLRYVLFRDFNLLEDRSVGGFDVFLVDCK